MGLGGATRPMLGEFKYLRLTVIVFSTLFSHVIRKCHRLDIVNGIVVLLQCIFVVGLRSLGTKMIDPYGEDLEDLSVILYVESTLEICSTIMNSKSRMLNKKNIPDDA
jgi:hypothetical protein